MKRSLFVVLILLPSLLFAGVIVKKNGERLEDINILSSANNEFVYIDELGVENRIPRNEVSAVLYDDGRYEEIKQQDAPVYTENNGNNRADQSEASPKFTQNFAVGSDVTECNVLAFGNYIMKFYVTDEKYNGTLVEYRIHYKGQQSEPEWSYLGTTPFAYTTEAGSKNVMINKNLPTIAEIHPFAIENFKKMKKLEFRLSKEGYKTVVVSPLVQFDFTGIYYFISLNKLKPLKENDAVEETEAPAEENANKKAQKEAAKEAKKNAKQKKASAPEPAPAVETVPAVTPVVAPAPEPKQEVKAAPTPAEADKKMIPKACKTEGQKAYDKVYKELVDKAVAKGYSKSQAYKMAYEAALKEKERVINECYHNVVELGEDFAPIPVVVPDILAPAADGSNPNQFAPRTCKEEGQMAYDNIYKETMEKSMRQGYSKSQAYKIAYDTAVKEKNRVIEECQKNKATE